MKRMYLLACMATLACATGALATPVVLDFESYTPGTVVGQDGWTNLGAGNADIVTSDNGPSLPGGQCVQLDSAAGDVNIRKTVAEVVANQGPLVTFSYDIKWVSGVDLNARVRMFDSVTGSASIPAAHWWAMWNQFVGSYNPDGSGGTWMPAKFFANDGTPWRTFEYKLYFGSAMGASYGQLLSLSVDGVEETRYGQFLWNAASLVDILSMQNYNSHPSVVLVDNVRISGAPLPSQPPVANAGPDQFDIPATYDGGVVTLDASASTDDGQIVYYRWSLLNGVLPPPELAAGSSPTITVALPIGQTSEVRLEVVDNHGLRAFDTVTIEVSSDLTPIESDNLWGPTAIRQSDISGTARVPFVAPAGDLELQLVNERGGGAWDNPEPIGNVVFDRVGNIYYMAWNKRVKSVTPSLEDRWESESTGEFLENGVVMVGERSVYAVGAAEPVAGIPAVWAFDKSNGTVQWSTELWDGGVTHEAWLTYWQARPLATLYNNKIYVVGLPAEGQVLIWQLDASTGAIDWFSPVTIGNETARYGNCVLVPDLYGANMHGLFFAGRSPSPDDGLSDVNAVMINPASGATNIWGADGMYADNYSRVIYSNASGRDAIYVVTPDNWSSTHFWSFDKDTGLVGQAGGGANAGDYQYDAAALSNDGLAVHVGGLDGKLTSYIDNGDGTSFTVEQRFYPTDGALRLGPNMYTITNTAGEELVITSLMDPRGWWIEYEDREPMDIVVLNLSQDPAESPSEEDLDDGPMYIDNVVVKVDGQVVFSDDFESYNVGPLFPQAAAKWQWRGTAGAEDKAEVVSKDGGKVLKVDPFGTSNQYVSPSAILPATYGAAGEMIEVTWRQFREDLTDNVYVGDYDCPAEMFQWDSNGWAYTACTDPDWQMVAELTPGVWQDGYIAYDYSFDAFDASIDGVLVPLPPMFIDNPPVYVDEIEFGMVATAVSSSGWTPTLGTPVASYRFSEPAPEGKVTWSMPLGFAVSPNGEIYYWLGGPAGMLSQRLRIVGTGGPSYVCGDTNCDGVVDTADIDNFVYVVVNGTAAPGCPTSNLAADTNKDGAVDTADIDSFVQAVINGGCQ